MSSYNDLIERLTHKLRIDPELQMDIANELRTHLQDSEEEFRNAGYTGEEASANAVKALGDEDELAKSLWQANRRRIRIRQVIKWTARVTLIPAAILVMMIIPFNIYVSNGSATSLMSIKSGDKIPFSRWGREHLLAKMTPEHRFILMGDDNAKTRVEREKSIADRWPENPVYYGNYISTYLDSQRVEKGLKKKDSRIVKEVIDKLNYGEKIDPENAFYNFAKSAVLLRISSKEKPAIQPPKKSRKYLPVDILDQTVFERGLNEFRQGLSKPLFTSHMINMAKLRQRILPPATNLSEYLLRTIGMTTSIIELDLSREAKLRKLSKIILGYALQQNRLEKGVELAEQVQLLGAKYGANADLLIQLLVAQAIYQAALDTKVKLVEDRGLTDQAEQARKQADAHSKYLDSVKRNLTSRPSSDKSMHYSAFMTALIHTFPGYNPNPEPMRSAEYAMFEQAALVALLGILVVIMLFSGIVTLVNILRYRNSDGSPKLLFVGWRRLGQICCVAILLTLAGYALYAHLLPINGREYGFHITVERVILEFAVMISLIVGLLLTLSYSAIRQRGIDAGMELPPRTTVRLRRIFIMIGSLLTLSVIVYIAGRQVGAFCPPKTGLYAIHRYGFALSAVVLLFVMTWSITELLRLRGEYASFRRTLLRSSVPIIASAVIITGLICSFTLMRVETSAAQRITGNAGINIFNEVETSNFSLLQERFIKQHKTLLKSTSISTPAGKDSGNSSE